MSPEFSQSPEKKPHVAHVVRSLAYGGLQLALLNLIKELPSFSHTVVFQSRKRGPLHSQFASVSQVRQCSHHRGPPLDLVFRLTKLLREVAPDVVLAHLFGNHTLVSWAAFLARVPRTYSVTVNDPIFYYRSLWKPMALAHAARPFCRGEIAVSHAVGLVLTSRLHLPERRVRVIPNGLMVEEIAARAAAGKKAAHRVSGDAGRVFMAAKFRPGKDHPTLVRAIQLLRSEGRQVELWLAGTPYRESDRTSIENLVDQLGIRDVVTFLGGREDVPELMGASDVVAHATTSEGLSIAMLEAMAAGVPLVATDIPSCREVLDGGRCGILVPPGDPGALAEAIARLLDDQTLRVRLVETASERVRSHYHVKRMAADYAQLLRGGVS